MGRRFERALNLAFSPTSCFVATEAGLRAATGTEQSLRIYSHETATPAGEHALSSNTPIAIAMETVMPHWDREHRLLRFGGEVIKRYHFRAANQEAVLAAFQEENWPYSIFDPLSPLPDVPPKRRLHETIKALNASQAPFRLRFRGDGTGERVCWEPCPGDSPAARKHCRAVAAAIKNRQRT